jgi:hypothetical protein
MKQLLLDVIPFEIKPQTLNENVKTGAITISGVFQRANGKNQNERVYPREILEREVSRYMSECVTQRRATGELDHPSSEIVNLKNVSHTVIDLKWDGDDLIGTLEILPTPSGNILRQLVESNILLGISSRGMGSVKQNMREGSNIVQDDFNLICFDIVSNPSTQNAFLTPTALNEGKSSMINKPNMNDKFLKIEKIIKDILSEI